MLVLSRKTEEEILIGDDIVVRVTRIAGNRVMLGVIAPQQMRIMRRELTRAARQSPPILERQAQPLGVGLRAAGPLSTHARRRAAALSSG
jgi:carbon storage regulator